MTFLNISLLFVSIIMNLFSCGILRNEFCKKDVKNNSDLYIFNTLSSILSMLTLFVIAFISGSIRIPSLYTISLGFIFGIATALCAIFNMKALEKGPLSYTTVIISCSMIIPALSGLILYNESISIWQYVGIALMIISFVFAVDKKNDKNGASFIWLILCFGAFIFCGAVGVMQKIHQSSVYKEELSSFLIIAFAVSAVFSIIMSIYYKFNKKQKITVLVSGKKIKFFIIGIISGIGIALCNQINMFLAGAMPAVFFYPVVNGGCMILTTAAGIIIWKERLSAKQWFGLIMGMAAILLLCNIF